MDSWDPCRARDLGQDGGAFGIVDGVLYGLENRCDLTAAQAGQGGAVLLTATCDSEGEQVSDMVTLARTSTGITVKRAGCTVQWESCTPAAKPAAHSANNTVNWTATMAQGTIFVTGRGSNSSTIQFSCRDGFDGSLHVDLGGRPAPDGGISFVVDGKVYIADEDGDIAIFRHSENPRFAMKSIQSADKRTEFIPLDSVWDGELINVINMGSGIYMTPIVANNVLYIATRNTLYAIEETTFPK